MNEITRILCETCVHADTCSHRIDLPGIPGICDLFVNRAHSQDIQNDIAAGRRCHVCASPSFSDGKGARITCGTCLLIQTNIKRALGDKIVKTFNAGFSNTPSPLKKNEASPDPDEIEEEA